MASGKGLDMANLTPPTPGQLSLHSRNKTKIWDIVEIRVSVESAQDGRRSGGEEEEEEGREEREEKKEDNEDKEDKEGAGAEMRGRITTYVFESPVTWKFTSRAFSHCDLNMSSSVNHQHVPTA
eukprot:g64456.t1